MLTNYSIASLPLALWIFLLLFLQYLTTFRQFVLTIVEPLATENKEVENYFKFFLFYFSLILKTREFIFLASKSCRRGAVLTSQNRLHRDFGRQKSLYRN